MTASPEPLAADWRTEIDYAADDCGVVLSASGDVYIRLAEQAAASVRATNPGLRVDLFCDGEPTPGVFDEVHVLSRSFFRPKFEAALRSRFQRTLLIDVDLVLTADVSDMFWVLNKYDLAACQVQNRNQRFANRFWRRSFPNAFPQMNGGVIAFRRNEKTTRFFEDWQYLVAEVRKGGADQPVLRELLWESDLTVHVLPEEYNLRKHERLYTSNWTVPAPRILHSQRFVRNAKAGKDISPRGVYGWPFMALLRNQIRGDKQLTSDGERADTRLGAGLRRRLFGGASRTSS
ncbi:putative nucleotide-diphospho-sugar transferase [Rhodovulum kholense]|uniref:Nucleotide-diphospho-sugar transferase n=1 Tax=Rhodovulum kholense TaxID=453584 RepID=A0A8E3AQG7_9RHOB|nr:putative nucleotide-diphospho-sugar transferase [Rhodovulum kholense]PTW49610.1 nucleotide-diphospho-sugar transferase [Rhodovulum kholense]